MEITILKKIVWKKTENEQPDFDIAWFSHKVTLNLENKKIRLVLIEIS